MSAVIEPPPVALTIAGSDPSGGAGIQADLKTFHAWGVYGTSVVTALTVQDARGVHAVSAVEPALVRAQIDAVLGDLGARALKTGMLGNAAVVEEVAAALSRHDVPYVVCDPVVRASRGAELLEAEGLEALKKCLLPRITLLTPNTDEVKTLVGLEVRTLEDAREAARALLALGPRAVLIKGGHVEFEPEVALDLFYDGKEAHLLRQPRLAIADTHGTGCALSAAITAALARGAALLEAVQAARRYVTLALARGFVPGCGRGQRVLDLRALPPFRFG